MKNGWKVTIIFIICIGLFISCVDSSTPIVTDQGALMKSSVPAVKPVSISLSQSPLVKQVDTTITTKTEVSSQKRVTRSRHIGDMKNDAVNKVPFGIETQNMADGITEDSVVNTIKGSGISGLSNYNNYYINHSLGIFSNASDSVGFENGILLSTGNMTDVTGPNSMDDVTSENNIEGDMDLDSLDLGSITTDATILEFNFTPISNVVNFEYVFASDEYNENVHHFFNDDIYNDRFGAFLNGKNIAIVPGTSTAVTVDTINNGFSESGSLPGTNPVNPAYYRNNDLQNGGGSINTEMDGLTVVMKATGVVTPGVSNQIKLAIGDGRDNEVDSNVFIKAGSFSSNCLTLIPLNNNALVGSPHSMTATLVDTSGNPLAGQTLRFNIISGPNVGGPYTFTTNGNGQAIFTYISSSSGTDLVQVTDGSLTSNNAYVYWHAAPVAAFNANPESGTAPLSVQFTDVSTGSPTSWAWTFGDGGTSAVQNPQHTYTTAGTFTATLVVTNIVSQSTASKQIIVTPAIVPPVAAFNTNTNSGTAPLTVQFTDASTGGTPTSWAWTFGDGGTSTVQNPQHTYTTAGTFTATLVVTNTAGQSTKSSTITVQSANVPVTPKITSIIPSPGQQGGKATVTITGTNFEKNKVKVSISGKGVTVGTYKTRSTTKIIVPFTIAKTATTGTRTVTVTNPSSNLKATKKFTITAAPKITKITSPSGKQGKTVKVTITGKNFEKSKSTVTISGKGVSVSKYLTRTTDKIVANIKIASSAAATKRTVTVKNPTWGATVTATTKFTVLKAKGTSASEVEPVSSVSNGVLSSPVLSSSSSTSSPKSPTQSGAGLIQVTPPAVV